MSRSSKNPGRNGKQCVMVPSGRSVELADAADITHHGTEQNPDLRNPLGLITKDPVKLGGGRGQDRNSNCDATTDGVAAQERRPC